MSDVGGVNVVISANAASFSAAMTKVNGQLVALGQKGKSAGHGITSSMYESSAAIRLMENPLGNNVRAIERMISKSKTLSAVMSAAFPVVGAIAMIGMVAKLGEEVAKFIKKAENMPKQIEEAFQSLNLSEQSANDKIRLTNQKLENQIALLEHKPEDKLAEQLDNDRIYADNLATSLENATKKMKDLLETNKVSMWSNLLGKADTNNVAGSVNSYDQQISDIGYKLQQATRKGDKGGAADLTKQLHDKIESAQQWANHKLFLVDNPQYATGDDDISHLDNADNRNILTGFRSHMGNLAENIEESAQTPQLQANKDGLEQQNRDAAKAKTAAQKAAADRLKTLERYNNVEKQQYGINLKQQYSFWESKINDFKGFTDQMDSIQTKLTDLSVEGANKAHSSIQQAMNRAKSQGGDFMRGQDALNKGTDAIAKMRKSDNDADTESQILNSQTAMVKAKTDAETAAAAVQEKAGITMTRYAVAAQMAAIHTREYAVELNSLKAILHLKTIASNADPSNKQALAAKAEAQNKLDERVTSYSIQSAQDQNAVNPASSLASVGFVNALDDFTNASKDAAGMMAELTNSTLRSLNGQIVAAMSGQKTNFSNMGAGIFRNVAGMGLQKAEGSVLSALGFGGKPDGSASKPLYVKMADGAAGAAGGIGSFFSKIFGGGSSSSDNSSGGGGSFVSGLMSSMVGAGMGLASGGPMSANMMRVVGENGPELFMPSTSGHIIPNHQMGSMFGGGSSPNITLHVDARGATDPAQVHAQVARAIQYAAPHISAATQKQQQERARRTPASARR